MKALVFAAALALTASAALAQTVTPGTQTGTTSATQTGTTVTNSTVATDPTSNTPRMDNTSGNMSGSDRKAMRKSKKMKSNDGTMKTKTKM